MDMTPHLGAPHSGVILTGGASGLGKASAQALAAVGRPVAIWDIHAANARKTAGEIKARYGVPVLGLGVDIADHGAYAKAIEQSRAAMGRDGQRGRSGPCSGDLGHRIPGRHYA